MEGCQVLFHSAAKVEGMGPLQPFLDTNVEGVCARTPPPLPPNHPCYKYMHWPQASRKSAYGTSALELSFATLCSALPCTALLCSRHAQRCCCPDIICHLRINVGWVSTVSANYTSCRLYVHFAESRLLQRDLAAPGIDHHQLSTCSGTHMFRNEEPAGGGETGGRAAICAHRH